MARRQRENQLDRSSPEAWPPAPCVRVGPVRRFFDLQAGTIWRDLVEVLPTIRGTLVDVGCGAQPYRSLLPAAATYVGLDVAEGPTVFGYGEPDTRYFTGDVWPAADGEADAVLATETLEHVPDPALFLREALRVLRPGGQLILTVPFAARWHFIPLDFWRFTPSGLGLLLAQAGFSENARVYARGNAGTVAAQKCLALLAPLILPKEPMTATWLARRALGLASIPFFVLVALFGNLSLAFRDGDDCLGYTVFATKPG
jgi:SAM-dependent methyltransferase